jgi:hypothetical protein
VSGFSLLDLALIIIRGSGGQNGIIVALQPQLFDWAKNYTTKARAPTF